VDKSGPKQGILNAAFLDRETGKSKTRETNDPKPRKGGVSCGTFKCTYIVKRIFICLYIGVSGGHQRPVAGTLTRLTKHLKLEKCRARLKKRRMSLLKKGAKIHLKNDRNSTEERAENQESEKDRKR
jgi:hypothetical protein